MLLQPRHNPGNRGRGHRKRPSRGRKTAYLGNFNKYLERPQSIHPGVRSIILNSGMINYENAIFKNYPE
jgi:hypothetical protein